MKMSVRNIIIKSTTFLMIGILVMLIANKAVFMHTHKLNDGTIIEHAHPFDKSTDSEPYKSHNHTKTELLFFQNLELFSLIVFLTFAFFTIDRKAIYSSFIQNGYIESCGYYYQGRAPPIS